MTSALSKKNLVEGLGHWTFVFWLKLRRKCADKNGMNIRNMLGNTAPLTPATSAAKVERPIKTDSSHDRDPQGQQYSQQEKQKEKMTAEQFEKALAILRKKDFIKDMNWTVSGIIENDVKYAWVQDSHSDTIRKIIEYDLWEIFNDSNVEETKGQLLKKTA